MSQRSQVITVEQLLALNEEIRALVRAGIPLEKGLRALGEDLPGRLGRLAQQLTEGLERGEGLAEVLDASPETFPPTYRAVVAAGVRSGRLSAALESISRSVRQATELHRNLTVALVYPFLLAAIASTVFVFSISKSMPVMQESFEVLRIDKPGWYVAASQAADVTFRFLPWIWGVVIVGTVLWWIRSRRAARLGTSSRFSLPTTGAVREAGRMATFSELLATLVEHDVPLPEAVKLAAESAGGRELIHASEKICDGLRRGDQNVVPSKGIPPLTAWLILTATNPEHLVRALRHNARVDRRRAIRMSLFLGSYLPIFLSALVGGLVGFYYVVLNLAPFYYLLHGLGQP